MAKAYSLEVRKKVRNHVKSHMNKTELRANLKAVTYGRMSELQGARKLVEGGGFLVSYHDQRKFLNRLKLNNNSNRKFSDNEVWNMYKELLAREIIYLVHEVGSKKKRKR